VLSEDAENKLDEWDVKSRNARKSREGQYRLVHSNKMMNQMDRVQFETQCFREAHDWWKISAKSPSDK
jgi:hypothetical protein